MNHQIFYDQIQQVSVGFKGKLGNCASAFEGCAYRAKKENQKKKINVSIILQKIFFGPSCPLLIRYPTIKHRPIIGPFSSS
jgi:hypothetical protein